MTISRRASVLTLPLAAAAAAPAPAAWESFPRQDAAVAREVVGASHRDLARVKELVALHQAAVNATVDWGFGDWETALGAAAHTGRREIAQFLLENGARLDIFAAAMLGMTGVVQAMVAARPGIEATLGPHGIPLLAHGRAGGSAEMLAYLQTLPGASRGIPTPPLEAERRKAFVGVFLAADGRKMEIKLASPNQLSLMLAGDTPRWIHHAGGEAFYPAGAPKVRVTFEMADGRPVKMRVADGPLAVVASRVE